MIWKRLAGSLFSKKQEESALADKTVVKAFRKRYAGFRRLLDANAALAELMAEFEEKLDGKSLFGALHVRHMARKAVELTQRMARSLEGMNPRHRGLEKTLAEIEERINALVGEDSGSHDSCPHLTLPLSEVSLNMVDWVGGKCANLGEVESMAGIPVPRGFAVTVGAFQRFMAHENLERDVETLLAGIDATNLEGLSSILDQVQTRVRNAPLPDDLSAALEAAMQQAFGQDNVRMAVRSSAQAEDGSKSFAGQFLTELGIARDALFDSYRRVIASLFTPSATLYRMHQGIPISSSAMAVACLEMVNATSSGVAYSHDPVNLLNDTLIINGVWGLGRYAVDGLVEPDFWVFTREENPVLVRRRPGNKDRKLVLGVDGIPADAPVAEEDRRRFSLAEEEVRELARLVMRLERHYGGYQDVEWARADDGRLVFLQSRPLGTHGGTGIAPKPPLMEQYPLLLEGGDIAYPGVGHGPVLMPRNSEELLAFPEGGVLVAAHSNAEYATVMDRAQAVLTQTGGITGHMATICREYRVPTILNLPGLMQTLKPGIHVTVEAFTGRVYAGTVEELLPLRLSLDRVRLQDTPVHDLLRNVMRHILPLNLTDPASSSFSPAGCTTLHDIMRYAHELSYHEMFAISDSAVDAGGVALKLNATLPIDLHLIDLDKGTTAAPGVRSVTPEEILSAPLKALLSGMLLPEVMFRKPRPINMRGFMSVMGQQMINPQGGDGRFGDKSYAIISDRYMNFSSRVGYHYSVLDAYCGNTVSKNYISFNFQGGAAGEERRIRRIRAIALVLEELGFSVVMQGDAVKSRFQKYPKEIIADRLDYLGRLLQVTRQMDMLMVNESAVAQFKEDFMNGIYR